MHPSGGDPSSTAPTGQIDRRGPASGFDRNGYPGFGRYRELRKRRARPFRKIDRRALGVTKFLRGSGAARMGRGNTRNPVPMTVFADDHRAPACVRVLAARPISLNAMALRQSLKALLHKSPRRLCSDVALVEAGHNYRRGARFSTTVCGYDWSS
jgi:hypothetical protein